MSSLKKPMHVKCVIAFFSNNNNILDKTEKHLIKKYGKTDYKSADVDFSETDYYEDEMGQKLIMRFISFEKLVKRNKLPAIKKFCIRAEKKFSIKKESELKRTVNIDPGLLSMENFILATGKPYSHRVYLGKGVWADLTLIYTKDGFKKLEWTYPNYSSLKVKKILTDIRNIYRVRLKK